MKVIPFTPESMQIIQSHWSIQSNFFWIAEPLKSTQRTNRQPNFSFWYYSTNEFLNFSQIKLKSTQILWDMYCDVYLLCVCDKNWSSPATDKVVFILEQVFPHDSCKKGAICPLRIAEFWEAITIHKGHSDSYCKVKWHLICICTSRLFCMLVSVLTNF
jgi:hypothetical protein